MRKVDRFAVLSALCALPFVSGCEGQRRPAATTFYERKIGPILQESCANSPTQSGCHVAGDDRGNAFGNLNVTSYDSLVKRRDLLIPYGPYLMPALLVKAVPPFQVRLSTWEQADPIIVTTDIPHAGGSLIDVTSTSFNAIAAWIQRGATENNAISPPRDVSRTPCPEPSVEELTTRDPLFDPGAEPTTPDYPLFDGPVSSVLGKTCAAGNCHGSPSNSLYLTCGRTPEQKRWNYFAASDYVSADAESSELLRRTVSPSSGGTYHEGGTLFSSIDDPGYRAIFDWAKKKGGPTHLPTDTGFPFFAHRVQPMLVKKGCMIIGCHSPAMGHEYRLRSGSGGHFGLPATRHNYQLTLEQVALESPDATTSRLLRKNLEPYVANSPVPATPMGMLHRGGALFGTGDACADTAAAENGDLDLQNPFCVIKRWIEIEREARMKDAEPLSAVVYVKRTRAAGKEAPQDFEVFAPGADLVRAPASLDAEGRLSVQGGSSLLPLCNLSAGIDVRRPAVSWDGKKIAFAARTSETEPWRVYVVDGATCAVDPDIDADPVDDQGHAVPANGELIHNFDPTFAPDGRLVFASTRGNVTNTSGFDYQGPQRTPADPSKLNANLYVREARSDGTVAIRQLTFLLNQELTPSFMNDGRLIMVTEKRAKGFYQLAARRMNLDGGDYHPLFGQRATIGYHQITDAVELADKNFAAIFSNRDAAHGAGDLGIMNRSLGVDQLSDDGADYLQDAKARTWPDPRFYQHSIRIMDGGGGVYRNPSRLPNGDVLVSYAANVADVANFSARFQIHVVNPVTGERSAPVVTDADDLVWPVAVFARYDYGVYRSKLDEPNGATHVSANAADRARSDVTFLDVPLLSSLLFQNTRSRRLVPLEISSLEVWEDLPPEPGVKSYEGGGELVVTDPFGKVYVRRRQLGTGIPELDGSLRVLLPGGVPIVLAPVVQLASDKAPTRHHQLEEMQFYPGETVHQGFQRNLFNGVCGSCHGAVSGYESDIAVNPDILTQASRVKAKDTDGASLLHGGKPAGPSFP